MVVGPFVFSASLCHKKRAEDIREKRRSARCFTIVLHKKQPHTRPSQTLPMKRNGEVDSSPHFCDSTTDVLRDARREVRLVPSSAPNPFTSATPCEGFDTGATDLLVRLYRHENSIALFAPCVKDFLCFLLFQMTIFTVFLPSRLYVLIFLAKFSKKH